MNCEFTYYKDFTNTIWRYDNIEKSWWFYDDIDNQWCWRSENGYSVKSCINGEYNDPLPIEISPEDVFVEFM